MIKIIATFILLVAATSLTIASVTQLVSPDPPPSFDISYDLGTKTVDLQANLTYMAGENLLYTYVFSFKPWSDSSSLEEPENCTNRRWQDFNGNNPVLWSDMWARQDLVDSRSLDVSLNSTAVNGDYLTWPTPSLQWSVVVSSTSSASTASGGNGIGIITYNGLFTIAELLSCANTYITESMDDTYFTYRGTFYIILVQPAQKYPGYPDEYATRSYTNPFVFRIPRNVDVVDTDVHNPTEIYSYVSQLAFERYTSSTVSVDEDYYYLHLVLVTKSPASEYTSTGQVVNYNLLSSISDPLLSQLGLLPLYFDLSSSSMDSCQPDSESMCVQKWSFYSLPVRNVSLDYNDTYTFNAFLESCPSGSASSCDQSVLTQYSPPLLSTIPISLDVFLDSIDINVLGQFSSNITYYTNTSFDVVKESTNYLPGEQDVVFKHRAYLDPLSNNYYSLYIENVYACSTVNNKITPYLGYDTTYGMQRYGCMKEEYINNVLNIPSAFIFIIALNESSTTGASTSTSTSTSASAAFDFEYYRLTLKSEVGGKFLLAPLIGQVDSFYLHVESSLFQSSRTGGGSMVGDSNEFETQGSATAATSTNNDKPIYTLGKIEKLYIDPTIIITPNVDSSSSSSSSLSTGAIVGITLGSVAGATGIVVAVLSLLSKAGLATAAVKKPVAVNGVVPSKPAPSKKNEKKSNEAATIEEMKTLQEFSFPKVPLPTTVTTFKTATSTKSTTVATGVKGSKTIREIKYIV